MCNLSQGIRQKGRAEGRVEGLLESIRALMENVGVFMEQAMNMLEISEKSREELARLIAQEEQPGCGSTCGK